MGFRSQFESLLGFHERWKHAADIYMVYGREAFPAEDRWPAPVPDGMPVLEPTTLNDRLELVQRFVRHYGTDLRVLVDDMSSTMMDSYDAYPFRVFVLAPDGTIGVASDKGASGFEPTLARIDEWLQSSADPRDDD